ncbi:MAG: hypothetical protein M3498_05950 [Deinococcota bacterium]|jgi:hypothetical protein|nr:hypothetical protein [Deinococcota bacterium]
MDPLSVATAFATVVSLIGQFRAERGDSRQADFNEFMAWLVKTNHEEVKELLESNAQTTDGIKDLLGEQHEALMGKLEVLDNTLASYASGIPGFSNLTRGLKAEAVLSHQALSILKQLELSGASKLIEIRTFDGTLLIYLDTSGEVEIDDPRFLEDDLRTLVEVGLLRHEYNSEGNNLYIFTRAASQLLRSADS